MQDTIQNAMLVGSDQQVIKPLTAIIIATTLDKENYLKTPIAKCIETIEKFPQIGYPPFVIDVAFENKKGLSAYYNESVQKWIHSTIQNFVFVHDDVEIQDLQFFEKLSEGFETYDVVGVAGSKKVSLKGKTIAWHHTEREYYRGAVTHPLKEDQTKFFTNSYGFAPDEVATLDGLFIAANRRVFEAGVIFNENYKFDFYDMAFCMNARLKGFKVGVIPIHITHYSHGKGVMKITYAETQEKFREEYRKLL